MMITPLSPKTSSSFSVRMLPGMAAGVLWLAVSGCSDSASQEATSPPASAGLDQAGASPSPPARPSVPPLPDLSVLDPVVRTQLREQHDRLREAPNDSAAWRSMAMLLHASDLRERAADFYVTALQLAPTDAMLAHLAGLLMQAMGEDARAAEYFTQAMRADPTAAPPHWRLGMIRLNEGRTDEETQRLFREALALAPNEAGPRIGLARAAMENDQDEIAIEVLRPLLNVEQPNTAYAHLLAAGAFQRLGRFDEAAESRGRAVGARAWLTDPWEQQLLALRAGRVADLNRAIEHARAGDLRGAIAILEPLRESDPTDAAVRTNLAAFYRAAGALRESEQEARAALSITPDHPDAHFNLGATLTEIVRRIPQEERAPVIDAARTHLERAQSLNPGNWETLQTLGDLSLAAGALDQAAEAYGRAAAAAPGQAEPRHRRAVTLLYLNRNDDAAESAREAARLRPSDPECWLVLTQALQRSGRLEEARLALERAAALVPDDPRIAVLASRLSDSNTQP